MTAPEGLIYYDICFVFLRVPSWILSESRASTGADKEVAMSASSWSGGRRQYWSLVVIAALLLGALAAPVHAATGVIYYKETGHYVRGAFRDFWDKNGGLANFGYPLTEEYVDGPTGKIFQYFERARFERARPDSTTVQLGLLGRELTAGRAFETAEPIANSAQRRYFPETKHIVQYGFKEIWETRGGLAVFGLPLSEEIEELFDDGQQHTIQWFERARFEFWPDLPAGQRVLLSTLGRQLAPKELTPPLAPDAPPPTPAPAPAAPPALQRPLVPASKDGIVVPQAGQPGQSFVFVAVGFEPQEQVSIWLNQPDGAILSASFQATADSAGEIEPIQFTSSAESPLGVWSFVAHGVASNHEAVGYFLVIGSAIGRAPPPGPGVPSNVDARVEPPAGPPGTIFFFDAFGFGAGEDVQITITRSDGQKTTADFLVKADAGGSIRYAGIYYASGLDYPLGLYTFTAQGKASGKVSTAYFVLTL
jgi:hypothetical protein